MLNPALKAAVRVPDATMDAMRMPLRFFATAKANGAEVLDTWRCTGSWSRAASCPASPSATRSPARDGEIRADLVVNATGPWSEKVARDGRASTCRSSPRPA